MVYNTLIFWSSFREPVEFAVDEDQYSSLRKLKIKELRKDEMICL